MRGSAGAQPVVLVVDDEADLLEILVDRLEREGYRVLTARDGVEALQQARAGHPGCVILDVKMPRLDGLAALEALRRMLPGARLIVLTGSPNRPLAAECRARGADDFLLKPFEPVDLLRRLAQAFDRGRG